MSSPATKPTFQTADRRKRTQTPADISATVKGVSSPAPEKYIRPVSSIANARKLIPTDSPNLLLSNTTIAAKLRDDRPSPTTIIEEAGDTPSFSGTASNRG
jgi:hypothetical protein